MSEIVRDPFGDEVEREYPPVTRLLQLEGERRPPYCNCPRMVRSNGWIRVWHQPGCTEVLGDDLAAIL